MKFVERALIMLCAIGYYLAVWRKPADISVVFVGGGLLSILYIVGMPFLLGELSIKQLIRKADRGRLNWPHWLIGFLFGVFTAYCVFSLIYNCLGQMSNVALTENCGLGLLTFACLGWWQYRKEAQLFYKNLLTRTYITAAIITLSISVRLIIAS